MRIWTCTQGRRGQLPPAPPTLQGSMKQPKGRPGCGAPSYGDLQQSPLAFSTDGGHMGNLDPSPMNLLTMAHQQPESCKLETQRPKFSEKKVLRGSSVLFLWSPHQVRCAHHCTRWKIFLRAPAGLAPTTAKCFNKCQGWHERSLSERTD